MSTATTSSDSGWVLRACVYSFLMLSAFLFLLPLYVMLVTSVKSLEEIHLGNMLAIPLDFTFAPWAKAWGSSCVGLTCEGIKGYFWNSIRMAVPAVLISTAFGAFNGYVLTKWRFPGHHWIFGLILFACFIPYQIVLLPMAQVLGFLKISNSVGGLVFVHVVYGISFTTLFFRNYYASFPDELVHSALVDGAGFFRIFWRILLPSSGPILVVAVIWQFTNVWNDFLFGASFTSGLEAPITVALNNVVNSSTGVKEYNVHMASAIFAGLPTLLVYLLAGRYFLRGLMSGAVKG